VKSHWFTFAALALACSSPAPVPPPPQHTVAKDSSEIAFPPTGAVDLSQATLPADGVPYELVVSYQGRTEIQQEGPAAAPDPEAVEEKLSLQVDYRQVPVATPMPDEMAASLVLQALQRRVRAQPPGGEMLLEIGDDRLRVSKDDKVSVDLRGAQPKNDLTPRSLLDKTFALLITARDGTAKSVTLRGVPSAKRLLSSLPLRESISYLQLGYPDHPVAPGDTWHAKRFFANPIGKLGLALDVEHRLVGFERIGSSPCARIALRAQSDDKEVQSALGFTFEEVRLQLRGDVWLDLATHQVVEVRLEDVAAVSYHDRAGAIPSRSRMRYEGHASLQRIDGSGTRTTWADGSKRFSAVK
jgi:hypothetical protein